EEKNFQNDGENKDLHQRMGAPAHPAPEDRKWQPNSVVLGRELVGGSEFQRHSGEMLGDFFSAQTFLAGCRIVDDNAFSCHRLQEEEMIHMPMQDSRQVQLAEVC